MSENRPPQSKYLVLACLAVLGYLASLLPCRAALWRMDTNLSHSMSVLQQIECHITVVLSFLQLVFVIGLFYRIFCRNPESPRAFWYFVAISTLVMGLDFICFSDAGGFLHIPDAIMNPLFILVDIDRVALVIWCFFTTDIALKIAMSDNQEATTKDMTALSHEIMSRPEYAAFLAENPERRFLYWEDLPLEFEKWLNPVKIADQADADQAAAKSAEDVPVVGGRPS